MATEFSHAMRVETDEARMKELARVMKILHNLTADQIQCLMIFVVEHPREDGKNQVHAAVVGSDAEIAKMLTTTTNMVRNGLVQVNTPPPTDEVKH
jgi:predicted transcriptional regulator